MAPYLPPRCPGGGRGWQYPNSRSGQFRMAIKQVLLQQDCPDRARGRAVTIVRVIPFFVSRLSRSQVYRPDALFGSTAISEGQPVSNANKCHLHPRLPFPNRHCAVSAWSPWTGLRIPSLRARYGNVCKLHSVFFLNVLSLGLCSSPGNRVELAFLCWP